MSSRFVPGIAVAVASAAALVPTTAAAQTTTRPPTLVTFAARACPTYDAIAANLARNNVQESLRDLGANTPYRGGESIMPDKEAAAQPRCTPLAGWRFVLGRGYRSRADVGPWGALSRVTDPFPTSIVTQASTPLLDRTGNTTGGALSGAVTVALTDEQANLAAVSSRLWAQAGVPGDPVLDAQFPSQYGFGALRCSIDDYNGDNVESISFPQGARHAFCFAYYVEPPPTSGTIVVTKAADAPPDSTAPPFTFTGNLSYTADHSFTLEPTPGRPAATTFYRAATGAADAPWTIHEIAAAGWTLTGLTCASTTGDSATTRAPDTGDVSIRLSGGDTVTCAYVNALTPPRAGLLLSKRTLGGLGTFGFDVSGPSPRSTTITTTREDTPVAAAPLSLTPGFYQVTEGAPAATPAGQWRLTSVLCNGVPLAPDAATLSLTLAANEGQACAFTNTFVPRGSLQIDNQTTGSTGSNSYVVGSTEDPSDTFFETTNTTEPDTPAPATGDDTSHVPLGDYEITQTNPTVDGDGTWTLRTVLCDGIPYGAAQGRVEVTLTAEDPSLDCTFVNAFTPGAPPPEPAAPVPSAGTGTGTPPSPAGLDAANGPLADLRVTKTVEPPIARPGDRVHYTIVVVNRGPDTAYRVVGTELSRRHAARVSLRASRGRCRATFPAACEVASLAPGQRVVVHVVAIAGRPGRVVDDVGVTSATSDRNLRNNRATATLEVRRATAPAFTG